MGRHHDNVNRVPAGAPNINDNERKVYIGFRFVGGPAAAWGANVLQGLSIPGALSLFGPKLPNPTYHWCVMVGDFYHQLQATSLDGGWNWYDNDRTSGWGGWQTYEVGKTRYNDVAINSAGIQAIEAMPEVYHVINNNCQTFTIKLLDLLCRNGRKKVYTSYGGRTLQIGFAPGEEEPAKLGAGKEVEVAFVEDGVKHFELLDEVETIMKDNTPEITDKQLAEGKYKTPEQAKEGKA